MKNLPSLLRIASRAGSSVRLSLMFLGDLLFRGSAHFYKRVSKSEMLDFIDHKKRHVQQFEACALVKSEIALITRDRLRKLLATLEPLRSAR